MWCIYTFPQILHFSNRNVDKMNKDLYLKFKKQNLNNSIHITCRNIWRSMILIEYNFVMIKFVYQLHLSDALLHVYLIFILSIIVERSIPLQRAMSLVVQLNVYLHKGLYVCDGMWYCNHITSHHTHIKKWNKINRKVKLGVNWTQNNQPNLSFYLDIYVS